MSLAETIVALSTPPGQSALAVIRLSGPLCKELFLKASAKKEVHPRQMIWTQWRDPLTGNSLDDVMAAYFEGPHSFTGQDSLEIFPHGNPLIVKNILQSLTQIDGVRLAEPGEFSRRAFEMGKIDLVQAESIGQLIHATDQKALENAQKLLKGELSHTLLALIEEIKYLAARMELDVDFVEEEIDPEIDTWIVDLERMKSYLNELAESFQVQKMRERRKLVVLAGSPNAGKSSLINALVKEDRLLVSAQAGTTRDYIEVPLLLPGGEAFLVDTAGLGEAIDELDARSQAKTREVLQKALITLEIRDGLLKEHPVVCEKADRIIYTKKDSDQFEGDLALAVSSMTGEGLAELKAWLNENLFDKEDADLWLITERQEACIRQALGQINKMLDLLHQGQFAIEILAFEMQVAREALQEITGEISTDEILNRLFAGFCIGK